MENSVEKFIVDDDRNAVLILSDGKYFIGSGVGVHGSTHGEICFNTGLTGYQETLTDPSYANQIITFTFPHIGNVGCNDNDLESQNIFCKGLVIGNNITKPSSYRATSSLNKWLEKHHITGIAGIDTRELTRYIGKYGAKGALIHYASLGSEINILKLQEKAKLISDLNGVELTSIVTTHAVYKHKKSNFNLPLNKYEEPMINSDFLRVIVIDYGVKESILNCLVASGCDVTVVPSTASAQMVKSLNPDGIFLSNGPGDPEATYKLTAPILQDLVDSGIPIFGVCMGHQLLAMLFKLGTIKMHQGHRGANHPVKNLSTGRVEITSQNHGFCVEVDENKLPENIKISHISLFDRTLEGIEILDKPIFSVQYHPESSPGPIDSRYLFAKFVKNMQQCKLQNFN